MSDTRVIFRSRTNGNLTDDGVARVKDPVESRARFWNRSFLLSILIPGLVAVLFLGSRGNGILSKMADKAVDLQRSYWQGNPTPVSWALARPAASGHLTLNGIIYSDTRPMAVINRRPCERGEVVTVDIGEQDQVIHCMDITRSDVRIRTRAGQESVLRMSD